MAKKIFGLPFDDELFLNAWHDLPDPVGLALLESGAMVQDSLIASRVQQDGNLYTIPFYNELGGEPANYDGIDDVPFETITGGSQSGIVYGRTQGWNAKDFTGDLSSGDPMGAIVRKVGGFWRKYRHGVILNVLGAIFGLNDMSDRVIPVSGKMGETTLADTAVDTLGEAEGMYSLAIMHSQVAKTLRNLELLEYRKGVDPLAYGRAPRIADCLGFTVVIDDRVPKTVDSGTGAVTYTTYLLGKGVLRQANGALKMPVETARDPVTNGGVEMLITRIRETIHPNGFSYTIPSSGFTESPTDAQLADPTNWSLAHNLNAIPLAKITTVDG